MLPSFWRVMAMTAVIAAIAGFGAAWLGAQYSRRAAPEISLRTVISLIDHSGVDLRPDQQAQIEALAHGFYTVQRHNSERLHQATLQVAEMLTQEGGSKPEIQAIVDEIAPIVRERYVNTVDFVSSVRGVLDRQQRQSYDRMIKKLFSDAPN